MKFGEHKWTVLILTLLAACAPGSDHDQKRGSIAISALPTATMFFLNDAQGTPIALADASGALVEQRARHPLGAARNAEAPGDAHDFVGNELDTAIGISDFNARPYRAETGIFLAPDPIAVFSPEKVIGDPRRAPAYTYSAGDPINLRDTNGEFFDVLVDVASIGYDVYTIVSDNVIGNENNLGMNLAALGADVAGALVPFATGGGAAIRVAAHGDEVGKALAHSDELVASAGAVKRAVSETATPPRFIVTESGVAIPTNAAELRSNLAHLQDASTSPTSSRKFVGRDSTGPVRVRVERAHPSDPNFTGTPDALHTVDHLHIDRRANGESGAWGSAEKVAYDWPF